MNPNTPARPASLVTANLFSHSLLHSRIRASIQVFFLFGDCFYTSGWQGHLTGYMIIYKQWAFPSLASLRSSLMHFSFELPPGWVGGGPSQKPRCEFVTGLGSGPPLILTPRAALSYNLSVNILPFSFFPFSFLI